MKDSQNLDQPLPQDPSLGQTPITSQPNPPSSKSKLKLPLTIAGIMMFLLLFGTTLTFIFLPKSNTISDIAITPQPTLIATVIPSSNPMANWKTYTNQKLKFSIQYPTEKNFYIPPPCPDDNSSREFVIVSAYRCGSDYQVEMSIGSKSFAEENKLFNPENDKCYIKTTNTINIDGRDEEKSIYEFDRKCVEGFSGKLSGTRWVYIYPKNTDIKISYRTDKYDEEKFEQILSTFKFVD